jgi:hypothetical protein
MSAAAVAPISRPGSSCIAASVTALDPRPVTPAEREVLALFSWKQICEEFWDCLANMP